MHLLDIVHLGPQSFSRIDLPEVSAHVVNKSKGIVITQDNVSNNAINNMIFGSRRR